MSAFDPFRTLRDLAEAQTSRTGMRAATAAEVERARTVIGRLSSATLVPHRSTAMDDAPDRQRVSGWLVIDMSKTCALTGAPPYVDLVPHSVLRCRDGALLDITPPLPDAAEDIHPFVVDEPSDAFDCLIEAGQIGRLRLFVDDGRVFCLHR